MSRFPSQRTPCLQAESPQILQNRILHNFHESMDIYESLFQILACEDAWYQKSIPLRHPLIFYWGHTATFYINKLILAGLIQQRLNPLFESMFAVGVDEMSWDDLDDRHYEWPAVEDVTRYRKQVRQTVASIVNELEWPSTLTPEHPGWAIVMGIEHERIHLETSSVLIRQQKLHWLRPHPDWQPSSPASAVPAPLNSLIDVPAATVECGLSRLTPWYAWDNEWGHHQANVPAFAAARYLTSNEEFLAFIKADGYNNDNYWDKEGLDWRRFAQAKHPSFWVFHQNQWKLRLLAEEIPMPWNWPVEVNYHEAAAFCRWKAQETGSPIRLPTEDEWFCLVQHSRLSELPTDSKAWANIHLDHGASPCAVDLFAMGDFFDIVGNVWQWTETPIYPYPGFQVHPLYDDFSTPTFDGKHHLIKGGSWISMGNEARLSARYAFRKHFFQHCGFRYVSGGPAILPPISRYESDLLAAQYAEFHYGPDYFGVNNFPKKIAELALSHLGDQPRIRALDLGCATGRTALELARSFEQVNGVDFSARLIDLADQLTRTGQLHYVLPEEGDLVEYREISLEQLDLTQAASRVQFLQGDACNLNARHQGYNLIVAANLIDRLYQPRIFLDHIHERLCPGGLLVLTSPYTWLEEHTERTYWLGGFKRDGESVTTLQTLQSILEPHFESAAPAENIPFVIRETARKFQHVVAQATYWRRRT